MAEEEKAVAVQEAGEKGGLMVGVEGEREMGEEEMAQGLAAEEEVQG